MNSLASLTPTSRLPDSARNPSTVRNATSSLQCGQMPQNVVRNGSKILHTRLTELHQERFEMKLYKQHYLCKECLKTWSARTDIVEEGHTLSHQLKRSVLHMAREGITATGIARICHCSPSSVIRIIDEAVELKSRVARLPENLCFDEFRSVNSTMSFICCDAEGSHDIVAILENRLTKTIKEHFMNRSLKRSTMRIRMYSMH